MIVRLGEGARGVCRVGTLVSLFSDDFPVSLLSSDREAEAMLTERAMCIIGIILSSSLVGVAMAGEVTDCQTRVAREVGDLGHWSWRTIEGKQCWYRGARWKPKDELRWAASSAAPSAAGPPETDDRTDGLDFGPTAPPSTNDPSEEWRAQFADLWPEAFGLTDNWNARPDVRAGEPLWPIFFLSFALLAMWQLVRSRTFDSHGPEFRGCGTAKVVRDGRGKNIRTVAYCTTFAAMWGGGMTLVVMYLLDFIDGAPRLNDSFLVGGLLAAFGTATLAEEVAELLGMRKAKAPRNSQNLATQPHKSVSGSVLKTTAKFDVNPSTVQRIAHPFGGAEDASVAAVG
jgi:hypothetical protein